MATPIVRINFRNTVNRIRKDNLLSEDALSNAINRGIRRSLDHIARYAKVHHKYKDWLSRAKHEYSIGRGNGRGLSRAIHYRTSKNKKSGVVQSGEVYINLKEAPWGAYQYYGTSSHGPKIARALVFFGRGSGSYPSNDKVVTRWVRGIEADPFLDNAVRYYRKDVSMWINDEIDKAVKNNARV